MATHPAPDFPDDLAESPKPLKFMPVDERLRLSGDTRRLDVHWGAQQHPHGRWCFAYVPARKLIVEGEIATPPRLRRTAVACVRNSGAGA
ncbi:MAG: hypothetical protein ABSH31_22015 [Bryobacteraceae bacterium]